MFSNPISVHYIQTADPVNDTPKASALATAQAIVVNITAFQSIENASASVPLGSDMQIIWSALTFILWLDG